MGFWQTGYQEFHEEVGLDGTYPSSPPIRYYCSDCPATFTTPDELRIHRFENHPHNRPVLFLRDIEVGVTPVRITQPITVRDVLVDCCTFARINGEPVPLAELGDALAKITNDTVIVELSNQNVSANFTIQFEIATEVDLAGVDRCFFNLAQKGRLDRRAVEDFIDAAHAFPTAIRYCDGICDYFYGVLAKERSNNSSLPYKAYHEKFTRAADTLKDFSRPLAHAIASLIAFHFNQFTDCVNLAGNARVGIAAGRFDRWMNGDIKGARDLIAHMYDDRLEKLLTDFATERFILWSVADPELLQTFLQDIRSMVRRDIPDFDRAKLHVLLAEFYAQCGNVVNAKDYARELRNSPTFGPWAERLLARLTEREKPYGRFKQDSN